MSLIGDVERAQRAERILKDPLFEDAFNSVSKAIHEQWETSPIRDKDGAHELRLMLKLLGDVRANLERAIADGKLAAAELQREDRRALSPAEFNAAYR